MAAHCPLTAFLCVTTLLTTGAALTNDQGCPEGWTLFGTRCFKFFDSQSAWTQSEKSCQSHGANLASIHSAEENAFVLALIRQDSGANPRTWIGGHDAYQEGLWMWSDGSVWDYSNWSVDQPDNWRGKENFVEINQRVYSTTGWNDLMDHEPRAYVCAKAAQTSVSLTLGNCQCKCAPT